MKPQVTSRFCITISIFLVVLIKFVLGEMITSVSADEIGPTPEVSDFIQTEPPTSRVKPGIESPALNKSEAAPGYCGSNGGSTTYERINSVYLTPLSEGAMLLVVSVYIANPNNCQSGEPCPEYDNSPENVNVWIDFNGDKIWSSSEKILDVGLTGYKNINYGGYMTAAATFSLPSSVTGDPTWMRANLGWGYDPNDPCEESWSWGNVLDQPVHLKGPQIKKITVRGIGTANNKPETGSTVRLEADIDVPPDYEITECNWTGDLKPGKGDKTNNCRYDYIPASGPGPHVNTYGHKEINLILWYKHITSGYKEATSKIHNYKVFFEMNGDDDGDCGFWSFSYCEPNWFEYWKDDGAVPGLADSHVSYDDVLDYGAHLYLLGQVRIGRNAYNVPSWSISPLGVDACPAPSFDGAFGIDGVASTLSHENDHRWTHNNWKSGGIWEGQPNSDYKFNLIGPSWDDKLPDAYESGTAGTSPTQVDSCGMSENPGWEHYFYYGDNEVHARIAGKTYTSVTANDWANPGKQAGVGSLSQVNPISEPFHNSPRSGPVNDRPLGVSMFLPNSLTNSITGNYSDSGVDTDGDSLFDSLKITAEIQVDTATIYNLIAWLEDSTGTDIAWAKNQVNLSTGTHNVDLFFDGRIIRESGFNGPYNLARVELRSFDDELTLDYVDDDYTTSSYSRLDFQTPAVELTGAYTDMGVDTDTDSLFNLLRVNLGMNVHKSGSYTIIGELEGSDPIDVVRKTVTLSPGATNVSIDFYGGQIFMNRVNGPYHLRKLRVENVSGENVNFVYEAHTTNSYNYNQFQHNTTTIKAGSFSDNGWDADSDGDFDYLQTKFQVEVGKEGTFNIQTTLNDSQGERISNLDKEYIFTAGENNITLNFPGGLINSHKMNGPYHIDSVAVVDVSGKMVDYLPQAHTTKAYNYTDFAQPLVAVTDNYNDQGRDNDNNGKYGYLDIDIGVVPGDDGTIIAQGRLVDKTGKTIEWGENFASMNTGISQVITLSFNGELILANGVDGPYELRDLVVYHSADPEQANHIPIAYTTGIYKYTDFELEKRPTYLSIVYKNYEPNLLFYDDFSNPKSGWFVGDTSTTKWSYQSGEYETILRNPDWWAGSKAPYSWSGDYSVEADFRRISGEKAYYGLIFGMVDWDHYYLFIVNTNQNYALLKLDGPGNWVTVTDWNSSKHINPSSGRNHLKVEHIGSKINVYANGHKIGTTNSTNEKGYFGLFAQSDTSAPITVRFDNFKVSKSGIVTSGPGALKLSSGELSKSTGIMKEGSTE